jgi:acetyl-CoA acetyltransferase
MFLVKMDYSCYSQVIFLITKCRKGSRFGHDTLVDAMLKDGLWDVYNDCAMGMCAELCADNHALTREDQVSHYKLHIILNDIC